MKKVGMVLLAAGNSKRYNGIKLLEQIGDKKMYQHILELSSELEVVPKIIVTQYEEIKEKALIYGFQVVVNDEPDLGISHSIHLGLQVALEIEPELDGVLFSVCDQPYLKKSTLKRLLSNYIASDKSMASVSYQGILGNPCIIGKKYFEDLFRLQGDTGGKKVICRYLEEVELVLAESESELMDIDKKEDHLTYL